MKVLLAGEGATELGDWHKEPAWRTSPCAPGVVEALAREVSAGGWTVGNAVCWRSIRKYRSGEHRHAETRNVLGVVLAAREGGYGAVLFIRDRDGSAEREADVEAGIRLAGESPDLENVGVAGGIATEAVEAWLLALLGQAGTERLPDPKRELERRGLETCQSKVELIREHGIARVPNDAASLGRWLGRVREVLAPPVPAG
ncbi:MAG: hypothetical protein HY907_03535 [Deltaproteobacteria bacterium]|nr:hypothetical protein [Deltaproteobacteria bacterium]